MPRRGGWRVIEEKMRIGWRVTVNKPHAPHSQGCYAKLRKKLTNASHRVMGRDGPELPPHAPAPVVRRCQVGPFEAR